MREGIVFYRSFREAIKELSPEDQLKAYNAILDYAFDGVEPQFKGPAIAIWKMAKPQIDTNNQRYENGKRGGRPKNQTETKTKPNTNQMEPKGEISEPKEKDKVKVKDKENDNVKVLEREKEKEREKVTRFTPPSLDDVKTYCRERNNNVNPERFIDFYSSKGWKVGNSPMKDWKAAVRTWENRDKNNNPRDGNGAWSNQSRSIEEEAAEWSNFFERGWG